VKCRKLLSLFACSFARLFVCHWQHVCVNRKKLILTFAAKELYGSSMRDHSFGFKRCHQLTLPRTYESSYPNFLANSSSVGFSVSKSNLSNTANVSCVSRCCGGWTRKRKKWERFMSYNSILPEERKGILDARTEKLSSILPVCTSSNNTAPLGWNLIPRIPTLLQIMVHTHLLGNGVCPFYVRQAKQGRQTQHNKVSKSGKAINDIYRGACKVFADNLCTCSN